jgi:hypothetical protein
MLEMNQTVYQYLQTYIKTHIINIDQIIDSDKKLLDTIDAMIYDVINVRLVNLSGEIDTLLAQIRASIDEFKNDIIASIEAYKLTKTTELNAHITNYNNPHKVTLAQIGSLSQAQILALCRAGEAKLPPPLPPIFQNPPSLEELGELAVPLAEVGGHGWHWNPHNTNSIDRGSFWKVEFTFPGETNKYYNWTPGHIGMCIDIWPLVYGPGTYGSQHPRFPAATDFPLPHKVRGGSTQIYACAVMIADFKGVNYTIAGQQLLCTSWPKGYITNVPSYKSGHPYIKWSGKTLGTYTVA